MNLNRKPNILFILSDQQRHDTLGCYGQKLPISPNLDRLASEGVKFQHAFTCQPVCGPARSCLQTGLYATETGCYKNDIPLPTEIPTLAKTLTEHNYDVAYVGKWHLAETRTEPVPPQLRGGYKDFWIASDILEFTSSGFEGYMWDQDNTKRSFQGYRADCTTDFALEYLANRIDMEHKDQPFFLFLSYIEPHHQNNENRFVGPVDSQEKYSRHELPSDLIPKEGDYKESYADYLGACAKIDENVGRILEQLEQTGELNNTIIIYTSDHGCHFKTRNSEYKRSWHENSIRIPLIINGPGFQGGQENEHLVSLIDLPKTILDMAQVEAFDHMQGHSLVSLVDESMTSPWDDRVYIQISESCVGRSIRTPEYKYAIVAPDLDGGHHATSNTYMDWELFDLTKDPDEKHNLIDHPDYQDIRIDLQRQLLLEMQKAQEAIPELLDYDKIVYDEYRRQNGFK